MRPEVLAICWARISGLLLAVYVLAKTVDTLVWINRTSPGSGFPAAQYYSWQPFGTWILFAEIVLFGLVPALILLTPRLRARTGWLVPAAAMACCGVALNRFVLTVQTLALPTLSFDQFLSYYAELAGDRHVPGGGGVRRSGLFLLVPLLPAFSRGARIETEAAAGRREPSGGRY